MSDVLKFKSTPSETFAGVGVETSYTLKNVPNKILEITETEPDRVNQYREVNKNYTEDEGEDEEISRPRLSGIKRRSTSENIFNNV